MKQLIAASLCVSLLAACGNDQGAATATRPRFKAELARTSYGIVHVQADNFGGLGYGLAYAYAQDNICMLADSLLTVRGERSRYFGPDAFATRPRDGEYGAALDFLDLRNEDSDFFFKGYLDLDQLRTAYAAEPSVVRELLAGYVAGYNRYLREQGADLPAACHGAPWVTPIGIDDLYLLIAEKALHGTGEVFAQAIVAAARDPASTTKPMAGTTLPSMPRIAPSLASNGLAIGRDASLSGHGLLLANPHYPWTSTDRFYQLHLTLPGVYDVMGVSLGGLPIVVIGFNKDVAWTHTVTKAIHFTTFRLRLDPADPSGTTYFYDGQSRKMSSRAATITTLQPDGSLRAKTRHFYFSHQGAVMILPGEGNGWSATSALVLGDPNRNNARLLRQWMEIGRAVSVNDLKSRLDAVAGLPWVNTVAADRGGGTLYADASVVPNMDAGKFRSDCLLSEELLMFDGARSACAWEGRASVLAGVVPPAQGPSMQRADYVGNSNDGYWLSNARQLLTGPPPLGYSPLYGPIGVEQHLRTRIGFVQIEEMLAARGRLGLDDLAELQFSNRIYAAELVLPELLPACVAANDPLLEPACSALGMWDRKANLDSRGAVLFREFWNQAAHIPGKWAVAFNPSDPVHTPHALAAAAMPAMLGALKDAVLKLQKLGIPLGGRLGDYQYEMRNGVRTPIHGGIGDIDGCYNSIHMANALDPSGYRNIAWGSSYIQLATFDESGPIALGILAYGQSTDPASPHYADQIALYSDRQLPSLPFSREAILADKQHQAMILIEY
ncbi:penicillin acylase family protein [Massilia sp. NR 4-1]|uniref:penicillin acylase family protein n=1 Tax=Massilia sp. NR 4-1 TaxID=1678028 RepID=UPI00067CB517|nr:penicillin acylase family protein [Massilia sp. NR 4-1]